MAESDTCSEIAAFLSDDSMGSWRRILGLTAPTKYRPGTQLFQQGARVDEVLLLECGVVKLTCAHPDGREAIVSFRQPGDWVDLASAVLDTCYPTSATTCSCCRIYRVRIRLFRQIIGSNVEASRRLLFQCGKDLADHIAMLAAQKTVDASERLAQFLPPSPYGRDGCPQLSSSAPLYP